MTTVTEPAAPGWDGYWETLHAESWLYREQSELYVEKLLASIDVGPAMRVLDFGCGFGFVVELLASRVAEVCFWDGAENMRRCTQRRVEGRDNCRLLELSDLQAAAEARFDLILVNSVVQYMTAEQFAGWLADWRRLLAPGGRLVISDLIPPKHGSLADVLDLLRFSRRRGVLWRAVKQLVGGFFRYGKNRQAFPLTRYGQDELTQRGQQAGLRVTFIPNLTQFTKRTTARRRCSGRRDMEIYQSASDQPIVDWQWYEPSLRNITQLMLRRLPRGTGRALDVGCGTGRMAIALAKRGWEVHGIDPNPRVIDIARQIAAREGANVRFLNADVQTAGAVEAASYDAVVCSEVLEHVEDYQPIIAGMHTALKPGGTLVISVPYDPRKWSVLDEYGGHVRRYTRQQMVDDLAAFQDVNVFITGFPFYRLLVRTYLAKTRLLGQKHSNEALWTRPSTYVIASLIYPFARLDNLFAFTGLGDQMIVSARKAA